MYAINSEACVEVNEPHFGLDEDSPAMLENSDAYLRHASPVADSSSAALPMF